MAITGRTALLATFGALVVGLLLPHWTGLLAVQLSLLLAILYDLVRAAPVRSIRFTRSGDTTVRLHESASVTLTLANPSSRLLRAHVRDAWPPSSWSSRAQPQDSRHQLTVPAHEFRRISTTLTPARRGDRKASIVTVRSYGPLGLAARQGNHSVPWTIRVLPAFPSRKHLPAKLSRLRELDGRTSMLTKGAGTEFDSLREYVPGDDTRTIDWRATARQSTLAVRTWRPERDRHVLLVLDTGRTSAGRVGDTPRLDASMDAALLLTALASRARDRVDLLAYDRQVRASVRGNSATASLAAIVSAMAPLEPELVETNSRGLTAAALSSAPPHSLIVLFTGLEPAPVQQGLLPTLGQLTQRHTVVLASVADPGVADMTANRGSVQAVYEAAAAARTIRDRLRTAETLRSRGVTVVDSSPDALASKLADTYLALKATGRL